MSFNLENQEWDSIHNGKRVPIDPITSGNNCFSFVDQSRFGTSTAECLNGNLESCIIAVWNLNNPDNPVPADYKWKGPHDDSILQYVIPEMK